MGSKSSKKHQKLAKMGFMRENGSKIQNLGKFFITSELSQYFAKKYFMTVENDLNLLKASMSPGIFFEKSASVMTSPSP